MIVIKLFLFLKEILIVFLILLIMLIILIIGVG